MDLGTAALLTAVLMPSDLSARLGDTGWGHGQAHPGSALGLGWRNATACRNHRGAKPGKRRAVGVVAAMARWDTALGWQLKQSALGQEPLWPCCEGPELVPLLCSPLRGALLVHCS